MMMHGLANPKKIQSSKQSMYLNSEAREYHKIFSVLKFSSQCSACSRVRLGYRSSHLYMTKYLHITTL
jgi:hypothetical protein